MVAQGGHQGFFTLMGGCADAIAHFTAIFQLRKQGLQLLTVVDILVFLKRCGGASAFKRYRNGMRIQLRSFRVFFSYKGAFRFYRQF